MPVWVLHGAFTEGRLDFGRNLFSLFLLPVWALKSNSKVKCDIMSFNNLIVTLTYRYFFGRSLVFWFVFFEEAMSDVMRLSVRVMRVHLTVTLTVASERARTLQMMNNLLQPATFSFFCHRKLSETLAHYFWDFLFFLKFCNFCWEWIGYQTCAGTKKSEQFCSIWN